MANAARTGMESGRTSRTKIWKWSAPSIRADSKMSFGRPLMKLCRR